MSGNTFESMELELLLQTISDIVIGLSIEQLIISFNCSAENFYNCKADEVIGKNIFELFASKGFRTPINGDFFKSPLNTEIYSETQNGYGRACILKWVICPIDSQQTQTKLLLIGKDATFKRTAIADNLINIINCTPGSLYWKDKSGRYLGCNQFMVDTSGLNSVNDIIGKTDFELWPDSAPKLSENDQYVMQTGENVVTEEIVRISSGKIMYFTGVKMPLRDESNHIIGVVGNSLDITALKVAQQELIIVNEAAEKANQGLKLLAAAISHELRTPLLAISSAVSGLQKYLPKMLAAYQTAKQSKLAIPFIPNLQFNILSEVCSSIKEEVKNANLFINFQLINLAQASYDKNLYNTYSITDCIKKSIQRYPLSKNQKNLIQFFPNKDFMFFGIDTLIIHVFFNLFKNALYFIKVAGKGVVDIKLGYDNKHNKVHFKDTSKGISKEILSRVFEKFYTQTHGGTGVGLAFCKETMNKLGGDILCYSTEGEYTEFILLFPKLHS